MLFYFTFDGENPYSNYNTARQTYVQDAEKMIELEKQYHRILLSGISNFYAEIERDFNEASNLEDYWKRYAPRQRGRGALNEAYPWGEVGEKVLDAYIYKIASSTFPNCRFVGLPFGHDVRFVTEDAFVHLDIKSTGTNDRLDEVVASPNQVSGDGLYMNEGGLLNTPVSVHGAISEIEFQPELPPFYIIDGKPRLTITMYLKCAYDVVRMGEQPLMYIELICVPNGLLMFDTYNYQNTAGLLIPGKDIVTSIHKRTRIKLIPLSSIDPWRCTTIRRRNGLIIYSTRL